MASFARRVAPAAALGGLAVVIVGVADPALAGHTSTTATGATQQAAAPPAGQDAPAADAPAAEDQSAGEATTDGSCTGDAVTGQEVMTRWGPVQVSATVSGGSVCAVQAIEWPQGDGRSQQINAYAIPQLDAWASASPTQFDYVSGATYTSQGYHQSLQSILDSL
jgi:uncharacterized protein with FMN-binding domain